MGSTADASAARRIEARHARQRQQSRLGGDVRHLEAFLDAARQCLHATGERFTQGETAPPYLTGAVDLAATPDMGLAAKPDSGVGANDEAGLGGRILCHHGDHLARLDDHLDS